MNRILAVRVGLALAALVSFGLGVYTGDDRLRWIGIGMLVASLVLRLLHQRPRT